jgi:hypothetical protein
MRGSEKARKGPKKCHILFELTLVCLYLYEVENVCVVSVEKTESIESAKFERVEIILFQSVTHGG